MTDNPKNTQQRPPKLNLPFEKRDKDAGSWIYYHRTALCVTVIAYLALAIAFVSSRIIINKSATNSTFIIDFSEFEELQKQLQQAQELNDRLNNEAMYDDFSDVSNRSSNENAELNENLRDDRGTDASSIYDQADKVQDRIRANRERYEQGLREEQAIADKSKNKPSGDSGQNSSVKVKGRVTVSYSLNNPIRSAVNLVVPAYRCEGGGEVTINIVVNQNGDVVSADVDKTVSSSDYCMTTTAVSAARASKFNVDTSAPTKQNGTINYIFIPQ